jgi:putative endonuclease
MLQLMPRIVFGVVNWRSRNGLSDISPPDDASSAKRRARTTGIRGETYAYWYLRRHGYVMIGRNFMVRGLKGEIDLVGYDGPTIAFVEVKTRTSTSHGFGAPEDAVTQEKQHHLVRIARHFLREYHAERTPFRFDVLAIESPSGRWPIVRLHKGAFAA